MVGLRPPQAGAQTGAGSAIEDKSIRPNPAAPRAPGETRHSPWEVMPRLYAGTSPTAGASAELVRDDLARHSITST